MGLLGPPDVKKMLARKDVGGLIKALRYKDSQIRQKAAHALGDIRDKKACEALLLALDDEDSYVCALSVEALGYLKDSRAVDPLVRILQRNTIDTTSKNASLAIKRIGDPPPNSILVDLLSHKSKNVREDIAELLYKRGWKPGTDELKVKYYVAQEKWYKTVQLGTIGVDPLINALIDISSQEKAAEALGEIGDKKAVPYLISVLDRRGRRETNCAVIKALGKIGDVTALDVLGSLLEDDDLVYDVAQAIGQIGGDQAADYLMTAFDNVHQQLVQKESTNLYGIEGIQNKEEIRLYNFRLCRLQQACAIALTEMRALSWRYRWQTGAIKTLINVIRQRSPSSSATTSEIDRDQAVIIALGIIGGAEAFETLVLTLKDENYHIRAASAYALGKLRDKRAVVSLIAALGDHEHESRCAVIKALGDIGDQTTIPLLRSLFKPNTYFTDVGFERIELLSDDVFKETFEALSKLGDEKGIDELISLLTHGNSEGLRREIAKDLFHVYTYGEIDKKSKLKILSQREAMASLGCPIS
jgi:HEAT repeat protein